MLNDILTVGGSVITLFLMMGVGFLFARKHWLTEPTLAQISKLLLNVVCPCAMIDSLQLEFSTDLAVQIAVTLGLLVVSYVVCGAVVKRLYRKQPPAAQAALRFGTVYGNVGFMGMPLITAVLGAKALPFCAVSMAVFGVGNWTQGVGLMGQKCSVKKAILNPGVIGCAVSLVLFFGRLSLPWPVASAVKYMGSLNTPLAMVVIGGQMAASDLLDIFRERRLYTATAVKLAAVPLATLAVLAPLRRFAGLDETVYLTLGILSGCPAAGSTSIFCQTFGQDTETAAKFVTLSTLLSILTLPVVALLTRALGG